MAPLIISLLSLLRAARQIRFTTVLAGLFGLYLLAPQLFPIGSLPYQSSITVFVAAMAIQRVWGYAIVSLPLMIGLTFWLSLLALTAPNAQETIRSLRSSVGAFTPEVSLPRGYARPKSGEGEFEPFVFDKTGKIKAIEMPDSLNGYR